jgi:DNA-3-methyladenine glycosylase I
VDNKIQIIRCPWCGTDDLYIKYHDNEWGKQVFDDNVLFEFLILESAQAGLSWITILRKRENYRKLFANFDPVKVAAFTSVDIENILQNAGIIRNRLKVQSAVSNAQLFLLIQQQYGSFYNYLYLFIPNGEAIINNFATISDVPAKTTISDAIAKDLKKRGFKFFGSVICYAYMQAVGMVNDHLIGCDYKQKIPAKGI